MSSPSVWPTAPIEVEPPLPNLELAPPSSTIFVAPVQGPMGPPGPAGDAASALAHTYTTSTPAMLHQIHHSLPFKPAGIVCQDTDGSTFIGWTVAYPSVGIVEVSFGVAVTPTIYLS